MIRPKENPHECSDADLAVLLIDTAKKLMVRGLKTHCLRVEAAAMRIAQELDPK